MVFQSNPKRTLLSQLRAVAPQRLVAHGPLFIPQMAETGYQPDALPVNILNTAPNLLLTYPEWDDIPSINAWLQECPSLKIDCSFCDALPEKVHYIRLVCRR